MEEKGDKLLGIKEELTKNIGKELLIILNVHQLNILGQPFRPIFCGTVNEVGLGHLKLTSVVIKMPHAPFYKFPTPLLFPLDKIQTIIPNFDSDTVFPFS